MGKTINQLLDLPQSRCLDTAQVDIPRLGLRMTLQEVSYNKIVQLRGEKDAELHYLLASIQAPDVKDRAWWQEHMRCPTPLEALRKLLKKGEVEKLCKVADTLNGYGPASVILVEEDGKEVQRAAVGAALEDLEKN